MSYEIFWPGDILTPSQNTSNLLVVGVKTNSNTFVVITTLSLASKSELENLNIKLPNEISLGHFPLKQLSVIGTFDEGLYPGFSLLRFHYNIHSKHITCTDSNIIVYEPPCPVKMQLFSLTPIAISSHSLSDNDQQASKITELIEVHDQGKFKKDVLNPLEPTIGSLNDCWRLRNLLSDRDPTIEANWERSSSPSIQYLLSLLLNFLRPLIPSKLITQLITTPLSHLIFQIIILVRHCALVIIKFLNLKLSKNLPSLIELSATAQQIDLRLQQLCNLPKQYLTTSIPSTPTAPTQRYSEYIRLYNTLWLILNDIMIGFSVGSLLIDNRDLISRFFTNVLFTDLLYHDLNNISIWLMSSPGGIKLNKELSSFLSDLFRWIVEFWKISLVNPVLAPFAKHLILAFGVCCSFGGLTLGISILIDFINVVTFHIYCFYYATARIYNWQLDILLSLFYLFCGRKRNVLRDRIDSMEYELDEVFLGILLFTVLLFLLPTVLAFYVIFTLLQVFVMVIICGLEIMMSLLNHSPIFAILLRLKEPKRIPNGVEFRFNEKIKYVEIISKPLSCPSMFASFFKIMKSLPKSYISFLREKHSKYGLFMGLPVTLKRIKLYKLLYENLPEKPIETSQLLREFDQCQTS